MRKFAILLVTFAAIAGGSFLYLNTRQVTVITAFHNQYTAQILVDHLPITNTARINWWLNTRAEIYMQHNIPSSNTESPWFVTIYAFGDGYKEEGKGDRRCFSEISSPRHCIDKTILMSINQMRSGDSEINVDDTVYILSQDGKRTQVQP